MALGLLLWHLISRRRAAQPRARLRRAGSAFMADFLIPDGEGGEIHIENALLCSRGIVLITIKDVSGNVFGSDNMDEWTVITGQSRFTFSNPQNGLYDRTAAVKRIVPDVPVEGYVGFTDAATFSKGYPQHVVQLSALLLELEGEHAKATAIPDAFRPSWDLLQAAATVVQLEELTRAA